MGKHGTVLVDHIEWDYSAGGQNVTDAAWVEIKSSLSPNVNHVTVFDSSGRGVYLGYGPSGSEVTALSIPPGGLNGKITLLLHSGMRLALKGSETGITISAGKLILNFFQ